MAGSPGVLAGLDGLKVTRRLPGRLNVSKGNADQPGMARRLPVAGYAVGTSVRSEISLADLPESLSC